MKSINEDRATKHTPLWGGKENYLADSLPVGCCGRAEGQPWMDWVESGIEFFGCEGERGKSVIGRALMLENTCTTPKCEKEDRDFAKMHEDFFESLLKEQLNLAEVSGTKSSPPPVLEASASASTSASRGGDSSIGSSVSSQSSSSVTNETASTSSIKTQKRRRPLKLHRLSPRRKNHARVAPIEAYNQLYNPNLQSDQLSMEQIAAKSLSDPPSFIHPCCVLQKDKGKGDPLGSTISAEGRDACLEKLREKMSIVVQVSGEERRTSTGMKRRTAKVSEHAPGYIETRSIIEVRLGFLSMQYGLLLHWDYTRTEKIIFIVLRKMCHDSFYTKVPDILHQEAKTTTITRRELEPPPLVVRNFSGSHAIYQRMGGTEVVLVDPPYRVKQPEVFAPSALSVEINKVTGLSKNYRWTISITFAGHTELAHLLYNNERRIFEAKRLPMKWEMTPVTSFDLAGLEIRLFEQKKRKHSVSRLASTTTMPLGGLISQPSTSQATSWKLTMPFSHDEKATLTLSLTHQSDYAHWLYKELDARRHEEVSGYVGKSPYGAYLDGIPEIGSSTSSSEDVFEWLCGVCFKEYYLPVEC